MNFSYNRWLCNRHSKRRLYKARRTVVAELKSLNKPFVILLNSTDPNSDYTKELSKTLAEKYDTTVIPINCEYLDINDINNIFSKNII